MTEAYSVAKQAPNVADDALDAVFEGRHATESA